MIIISSPTFSTLDALNDIINAPTFSTLDALNDIINAPTFPALDALNDISEPCTTPVLDALNDIISSPTFSTLDALNDISELCTTPALDTWHDILNPSASDVRSPNSTLDALGSTSNLIPSGLPNLNFPNIIPAPSVNPTCSSMLEPNPTKARKEVFIVHGHDHVARDIVAKFVNNWGLTATILDKQSNKGRTVIEKFEDLANEANFAIVLLTPDDVGTSQRNMGGLKPRARQNVIFELGYFFKGLGRQGVCILLKGNIEIPSDIQGVVYIRMDDTGDWQQAIIREMQAAGLFADMNTKFN